MSYHRITPADRYRIEAGLQSGFSVRAIAKKLKRSPSTISREINRPVRQKRYEAEVAITLSAKLARQNKRAFKIEGPLKNLISKKILGDWSPEQISVWLSTRDQAVSKQTIYRFIERERKIGNKLMKHLRILRKEGHDRKRSTWKPPSERLTKRTWIDKRPKIVEKRERLGDYER